MALMRDETRTARKHHPCDAWEWFCRAGYGDDEFEPDDLLIIQAVRADRGRILPGMPYIYQTSVDGDGWGEFKARQDMHAICIKYDLYPED